MSKMSKNEPRDGPGENFYGEKESFNFEEDPDDDFFGGGIDVFRENEGSRNNFYGAVPETEDRGYFEGVKNLKESFNFEENDDAGGFFGNVDKGFGDDAVRKGPGQFGIKPLFVLIANDTLLTCRLPTVEMSTRLSILHVHTYIITAPSKKT
jgi:hypothetical protein